MSFACLMVVGTLGAANNPPTIGPIPDQTVLEDQPTDAFQLALSDPETPFLSLQLSGVSSDSTVVPPENIFFGIASGHWYVTVTPAFGRSSGSANITVTASDGTNTASTSFILTVIPPPSGAARFVNPLPIAIPTNGAATPYPSQINVTGTVGTITDLTLTFSKLSHARVQEVNMLLVGPTGQAVVIFSHISGASRSANNVTVHLADSSFYPLPRDFSLWSEPLNPRAYPPSPPFPGPAPVGPYAPVALWSFNGLSANGTWSLYVYDDTPGATGTISGGWSMIIATSGGNSAPQISDIPDQTIAMGTSTGPVPFTVSDPDTPLDTLLLSTNSSNTALVPLSNIVVGGNGSNRTVTVTPVPGLTGTANITVGVSDGTNSTSYSFALTVSGPAAQVRVETVANGSGSIAPAQYIALGRSITVYAIARDAEGLFVTNLAADSWSLLNLSGAVVSGDLVPAIDMKSATFTAHAPGSAMIQASSGALDVVDSGTLTVTSNLPPKIARIADRTTSVGIPVGPFPITVSDAETLVDNLVLSGASADQDLVPNGKVILYNSGVQSVTVAPVPTRTGTSTITVAASDGFTSTSTNFLLTVSPPDGKKAIFPCTDALLIPNKSVASPYPSTNHVSGLTGAIEKVTLMLKELNHSASRDLELLLVGPNGQKSVLFSHATGSASHVTLGLDDAAAYSLPPPPFALLTGTYQPADLGHDPFPAPAPGGTYSNTLSAFNGSSPSGDWLLYVMNDPAGTGAGSIDGGWSLEITIDSRPRILSVGGAGTTNVVITWSSFTNRTYRAQYHGDLGAGTWSDLAPDVTATNTTASIVDHPDGTGHRYYRVLLLP